MHLSASESVNSQRCSISCFGYKQLLNGYSLINLYQNIISVSKIPGVGWGGGGGMGGDLIQGFVRVNVRLLRPIKENGLKETDQNEVKEKTSVFF